VERRSGREAGRKHILLIASKEWEVETVNWGVLTALPIAARITFTIGKRDDLKIHEHGLLPIDPRRKL
jgi:hypothetical protein